MFKLDFHIPPSPEKIALSDRIVSLGSCFSDNIGQKLREHKFHVLSNPFGTIYNPLSLLRILEGKIDPENTTEHQDVHYHWDAHGEISHSDKDQFNALLRERLAKTERAVKSAKWLILTFGTSYVYVLEKTGEVVANCHKAPQKEFKRRLLSPSEIVESFSRCIENLRSENADLKVILTVSPVRHVRDGLHQNNISKGILHHAVAEIIKQTEGIYYFPGYEIMIDELRDYRFYERDMIHPSQLAIDYIWSMFIESCMDAEALNFIKDWSKIRNGLNHRPFHVQSPSHQKFLGNLIKHIGQYKGIIDVQEELEQLKSQLKD
ncbi:GSCFA domain-containing protein [Marinoscillum sp. MHG1-6]|uniref:GSCFA domain-containing protein n=1 Tax=Marinoscillum sp. MHG1-6 TaxID=2959627 RepID=UPI0021580DB7|nr:GSCFA domain-containing protein [Marinoscillum sp. MHG1-6]